MKQSLSFLCDAFAEQTAFKRLCAAVENSATPVVGTSLSAVHKSVLAGALYRQTGFKIAIVTAQESEAVSMQADLEALGICTKLFPCRDFALSGALAESREYEYKRIDTLSALVDGAFEVVLMSLEALCSRTLPPDVLCGQRLTVTQGMTLSPQRLCEQLLCCGYSRCGQVEGAGQFAARGGIVDFFATDHKEPFRVEFWGDEVDSIACFDLETQRRTESLQSVQLSPAGECLCEGNALLCVLERLLKTEKNERRRAVLEADWQTLRNGGSIPADRYMPYLYPQFCSVADYLPDVLWLVSDSANVFDRFDNLTRQFQEDTVSLLENGLLSADGCRYYLDRTQLIGVLKNAVILDQFMRSSYEWPMREAVDFSVKRSTPWAGDLTVLCEDITYTAEQGGRVVILAGEEKTAGILREDLCNKGFSATCAPSPVWPTTGVVVTVGTLSSGFELSEIGLTVVTGRTGTAGTAKKVRRPKNGMAVGSLDELNPGDLVVHIAHGIGVFAGIQSLTNDGVTKDYIKIRYAGQDVLYVPVTQLDLVSRYIGADKENIRLHKLGGNEWQRTKTRVRKAVKDMAEELTALYAKRMAAPGYAFGPDTDLQNNFERRFMYEETADQLRCIAEIKADMERACPMDRLLCGDVGFGKTEVALRAAFKCICEGKQCALLVPTTILAWQHYNTALSRIGELPVTVKLLSRFVSPAATKKIIGDLAKGRVDLIIGTHRLISGDVRFKDLGLVIIDEEQRFGVAQKERLKELYPNVDVLTLSATPIPRTLNMAMTGLRDMSVIEEAPGERHPVQTYVMEQSSGILYDAIRKELRRGGQVYYLHNRVQSIGKTAARLQANLPDARLEIAHGQMSEEALSAVWKRLIEHEIDVLVCTTIIETGVDVPNVNTLIIEDADRMGLSQLHQLRGRVGRSARRAYAYFCFRPGKALNEDAAKRLEAIRQFTQFGSGFHIAMRDLEIRGAGSVLGGAQHGNMEAVGYDLYLSLLRQALEKENGENPTKEEQTEEICKVDLNIPAHIPESYIEHPASRMGIYKRIADIADDEDASDVIDELCDRFGEPPATVMGLIDIALLRNRATVYGIYEIVREGKDVALHQHTPDSRLFLKLGAVFGKRVKMHTDGTLTVRMNPGQRLSDTVAEITAALGGEK